VNGYRIPEDLRSAKREARRRYLRKPTGTRHETYVHSTLHAENVTGVGIGRKVTAGAKTDELAVRIYVRSKVPESILGRRKVPKRLDGIATDVIVSSPFRALGADFDTARQSHRPLAPGVSIGFAHPTRVVAGTLGALVLRGGQAFHLSNNHVLAFENRLPLGSPIVQPGMLDGGALPVGQVGGLADFVRLGASGNRVDAALATAANGSRAQPILHVRIGSSTPIAAVGDQRVHKMGRTTGHTVGTIEDLAADIPVRFSTKVYRFEDQILIAGETEPFALDGDSGALVVDATSDGAVGLLFAGSSEFAAANHLTEVMTALGVTLAI
jgi:hypothetical protein